MGLGGWPTIPFPQMDGNKSTRRSFQQLSEKLSHRDMCETSQTAQAPFATWTPPGAGSQGTTDTVPWEEPMSTNPTTRSSGDLKHCAHTHTDLPCECHETVAGETPDIVQYFDCPLELCFAGLARCQESCFPAMWSTCALSRTQLLSEDSQCSRFPLGPRYPPAATRILSKLRRQKEGYDRPINRPSILE